MRLLKASWLIVILLSFNLALRPITAQENPQALTVAIPEGSQSFFENTVLPRFYADNPDTYIQVQTISLDLLTNLQNSVLVTNPEDYYEALAYLANRADVIWIASNMIGLEASRAGYLRDLQPLVNADSAIQIDDYYPAVWQAFQWDNGFWAIPTIAAPSVLIYQPDAFDDAGLSYPNANWTMDDLAHAARLLSQPEQAALFVAREDMGSFLSILSGQALLDSEGNPTFATPEIAELVEDWQALVSENAASNDYSPDFPIQFSHVFALDDDNRQGVLLNRSAALNVIGFGVSAGSQDPEFAYELALYLSNTPEMRHFDRMALPARRHLAELYPDNYAYPLSDSMRLFSVDALENAMSPSSTLYSNYLSLALNSDDALSALELAQNQAENALANLEPVQVNVPLAVIPTLAPTNEVVLDFALMGNQVGFATRSLWEDAIEQFLAENPDIDAINLTYIDPVQGYWDEIPKHECITNYDFRRFDSSEILPLDPLLQADPSFDPDDLIGDVLQENQIDGVTYALPYLISPMMLAYDRELFAEAGLPEPDGTWTVSEFVDALRQLATVTDDAPLWPNVNDAAFWEMLMVGYGVIPIDYSTTPPSLHFTDEAVLPVVQQVLDLGKTNLIDYQVMSTFFGHGYLLNYRPAIYADFLSPDAFNTERMGMVSFPRGVDTIPVSFYSSSSFIFAKTQYPEACYRWLREITRHPELYRAMPAYHSLLDSPITQTIFGESGVASFLNIAMMMEAPNRVFVAPQSLGMGDEMFITRAYDRYVLEDADLASELENAVALTEAYWLCMEAREGDIFACLLEVDPTMEENLGDVLRN